MGNFYYDRHMFDEARPWYAKAAKRDADNPLISANEAVCLLYVRDFDGAFNKF